MYMNNAIRKLLLAGYYGYSFSGYASTGECVRCKNPDSRGIAVRSYQAT